MSIAPIRTLKRNNGGGARITYYDGSTELGFEYVATGQDVLHPSITMPTKTDKTFIGWSTTTSENNWVGELLANGQPMNLYAIYLDDSLVVASGGSITNSKYVSGTLSVSKTATWNEQFGNVSFTLTKGKYGTATAVAYASFGNSQEQQYDVGDATLDNTNIIGPIIHQGDSGSKTFSNFAEGSHGISLYVVSHGDWNQTGLARINKITLTNPTAWT